MNFKDLNIEKSYINQGDYNLVNNLICPALKLSVLYRRSVGFFSSDVLSLLMKAIPEFVRNNGKIQMIVSPMLNSDDVEAITLGYETKETLVNKSFFNNFNEEILKFSDENLDMLYQLIVRGILDFKVATLRDKAGMYHDKLGILTDKDNNHIVFYGSANSSLNGYQNNYEKVRVVKSWVENETGSIQDEIEEFDNLWNNRNKYVEVYDFMDSIKKSVIREVENRKLTAKKEPIELYDYQKNAIEEWIKNGYRGFYVMATGTGKTWTAIYSAKELYSHNKVLTVIAAPYKHLVKQWAEDVKRVFRNATIILVSSENTEWYSEAIQAIIQQKYDSEKQVILITTIKSFNSSRFGHVIAQSNKDKLLIVDEAHRFTSRDESLKTTYKYMLGLSATPVNGKNNEAGIEIVNFFGGQVFALPIEIALEKNFLVPYNYHPIFVNATEEEESKFNNLSAQMAACFKNGILVDKDKFLKCARARIRVIAMAEEKKDKIDYLINQVEIKDHFVVYCGDGRLFDDNSEEEIRHIQFVKNHLNKLGYKASQFTATEDINRRMELVEMFNDKEIDALVAIRCLDEGINIPSIKSALILASNDDYREFVQRRGRILRKYPNKKSADIYDVVVLPSSGTPKMALIELRRYYEYARLATNREEELTKLNELLTDYGLKLDDIKLYTEIEVEGELDE